MTNPTDDAENEHSSAPAEETTTHDLLPLVSEIAHRAVEAPAVVAVTKAVEDAYETVKHAGQELVDKVRAASKPKKKKKAKAKKPAKKAVQKLAKKAVKAVKKAVKRVAKKAGKKKAGKATPKTKQKTKQKTKKKSKKKGKKR